MMFFLNGNLAGEICEGCKQPLYPAKVHLFRAPLSNDVLTHAVADVKRTLQFLDEKAVNSLGKPLASTETRADGDYDLRFDGDQQDYNRGPVYVVVEISHLPPMKGPEKKHDTVYLLLTTLAPEWQKSDLGAVAKFSYCIPSRVWCAILAMFDVWVICGSVMDCDDQKPLAKVQVRAMDADWLKDDELGTAVTDAQGKFMIYYRSADFKNTFLSPIINVETPFSANLGPDVYFIVTTLDGDIILEETRQDGRQPGRKDVGNCFCVRLCVDIADDDSPNPFAMTWNAIGSAFLIPDASSLNAFSPDGYAGANYAITGTPRLTGQGPNPLSPGTTEYRFLVSDTAGVNGDAPLPAANFTKIVGVSPGLFRRTLIGRMVRYTPSVMYVDVHCEQADLDAQGWFDPMRAVERTFLTDPQSKGITPADLSDPAQDWSWDDKDGLMSLNTKALTAEESHATPAVVAGEVVPAADRIPIENCAIRFEIRRQIGPGLYLPLPGNGVTLNAMIINNDPMFARLALKDQNGNIVLCQKYKNEPVYLAYTGYHPHLGELRLRVRSNDGSYNHQQNDGTVPFPGPHPVVDHANNPLWPVTPAVNVTCTYTAYLSYQLKLHTGDSAATDHTIQTSFYYEA